MKALTSAVAVAVLTVFAANASAQPANTINAGVDPTSYANVAASGSTVVQWWSFTLTAPLAADQYIVIDTWNNTYSGGTFGVGDSELGLYDGIGNRINNWDDFGTLSRRERILIGNAAAASGDGLSGWGTPGAPTTLAAGTYYIAVGPFNVTFNNTAWDATVVPAGTVSGNAGIQIFSNVPAPGALALLGLAGLVGARRRRN